MKERIQKILASRGVASRRNSEAMIADGRVTCNGIVCKLGDCADEQLDNILLDGKPLPSKKEYVYIMLHKPRGYVTTMSDEKGRKNVSTLVQDCGCRVYPIGRLDMDSEGLLLFTNDGEFANRIMHPKHEINKTYHVTVKKYTLEAVRDLSKPIELDGYMIKTPDVKVLHKPEKTDGNAVLSVTIHEGRNRQVRRMCAAVGMSVLRLVRVSEGGLSLGDLPVGKWRYLTDSEVTALQS